MKTVSILGRRWKLLYADLRVNDGDCDQPKEPNKTIRIAKRLLRQPSTRLETLIHEGLHAGLPDLKEETVETLACDLARLIRGEGYKLKEEFSV
jgi:hypothetical protein